MESGPLATGLANGDFDLRPLFEMSVQERLIRYRPFCDNPPISVERLKPTVAELERRGVTFTHPPHRIASMDDHAMDGVLQRSRRSYAGCHAGSAKGLQARSLK